MGWLRRAHGFGIDLARQIDLQRAVDREKPPEVAEHHSVVAEALIMAETLQTATAPQRRYGASIGQPLTRRDGFLSYLDDDLVPLREQGILSAI